MNRATALSDASIFSADGAAEASRGAWCEYACLDMPIMVADRIGSAAAAVVVAGSGGSILTTAARA
jgi:hypothetical protein